MGEGFTIGLGIVFAVVGLLFFAAARLLIRSTPNLRPNPGGEEIRGSLSALTAESPDAILWIQAGGRLQTLNQRARDIFHLAPDEVPNLDRIAHRMRPTEAFIALCASSGRASLTLDGRRVEGSSYRLAGDEPVVMVVLRSTDPSASVDEAETGFGAQTLRTFTEISTRMAASLDLADTVRAILEGVEKLVPADYLELTLWDNELKDLAVYRLLGLPGTERLLDPMAHVSAGEGYSGALYRDRQTLLIGDVSHRSDIRPGEGRMLGLRSFLGIPLAAGNDFVGSIELGSRSVDEFHPSDVALLQLISGQATVALRNSVLYLQERRRSTELGGLAQVAGAFSSVLDLKGLYSRLVASISPLFDVEILGFLIYNENQRVLEGQIPFHGLPDQFVELYRTSIPPNSPAEKALEDRDVLITEDAATDSQFEVLGLDHLARAASLRDTVLVPMVSRGRLLGYLQASNHNVSAGLSQSELHLLTIIANQSAVIIENAFLVQQSRQRAQRAEALRQIVSISSSVANLDEILTFSIREISRLLHVDVGAIFLVDPARTVLQLHRLSLTGTADTLPEALPERSRRLLIDDPQFLATVTGTQRILRRGDDSDASSVIPFYQSVLSAWKVASLIVVPLVVRDEGMGEVWMASSKANFFDNADVQLVSTAAGQLAGAVEQVFLRTQTDEGLRLRLERLVSVSRISRELNHTLDIKNLIQLIHRQALHATGATCGSVLLFDLTLSADDQQVVQLWHGDLHEPTLSELETRVVDSATAMRVDRFAAIEEPPPHAGIQSALLVPVLYQQRVAGLIALHATDEARFSETDQDICQSLAVQAGFALGNAIQYEDQRRRSVLLARELDTIAELLQVSRMLRPSLPLEQSLTAIGGAVRQATPFQVNVISEVNPDTMMLQRVCSTGLPTDQWADLQHRTQPWASIQQLLQPEFRFGSVYFIPADQSPVLPHDVYTITVTAEGETRGGPDAWDPDDFILVPLYDSNNFPLGLISVDAPSDGRRPDRPTFEALEIFGIQAALMIENHRRTAFLENRVADLEVELSRMQQSSGSATQNLPVLLRKDLEQTVSLQALNRRIDRVRASLEITAIAGSQAEPRAILHTLANELLTRFALQTALIAVKDGAGVRLLEVIGAVPASANVEALFGQRNPLRQLMVESDHKESNVLLVANLENNPEWNLSPLLKSLEARSVVGLLLSGGGELRFGIQVVGKRSLPAFSEEDQRIFTQLAQQVGLGIQNRQLLTETQHTLNDVNLLLEFSLKLSSLQPQEILASLVETALAAVKGAQAGWAGLWDESRAALVPQAAAGYANTEAFKQITFRRPSEGELTPLPLRILDAGMPVRKGTVNFAAEYHLAAEDLLIYRHATRGELPDSVLILPLRLGDAVSGVLMLENFNLPNAFSPEAEALAYSLTQQAALSLDNARLYQATAQRAAQMQSLTRVSSRLTSSLRRDELIASLLDWLAQVVPYQTAILWMREENRLAVRAVRGFAGDAGLLGISVAEEESELFRDVVQAGEPVVVPDVRQDDRFPKLVEAENLSWVGLPLSVHDEVIGLLALEGRETGFFTPEQVQAAVTFGSQAAVALENARLFEESSARAEEMDQRSQRLALLNRLSGELGQTLDVSEILTLTAQQLVNALGADGGAGVLIGPGGTPILEVEFPQRDHLPLALLDVPLLNRLRETQGLYATADAAHEEGLGRLVELYSQPRGAQSLLIVPLITGQTLHGWMMVDRREAYRYLPAEMELARTVCNQAAAAIQTARLFDETRSLTEFLERRVEERTGELRKEHQNSQTLLRVISELSTSLDMNLVLNRALGVINESFGAQESMVVMLQGDNQRPYRAGDGLVGGEGNIQLEKEIMRSVTRGRSGMIAADITTDERFAATAAEPPTYRSVLAVPLMMGEDALGSLMLFHREPGFFQDEQTTLAQTTARQLSIAINNAELFNLIRDQAENLGKMLREQQIEASRSRAILEAVADGVIVTDDQGRITLYNFSAERILGLKTSDAVGQNLELFNRLFHQAGAEWLRTIREWMREANPDQDEIFTDRFELDNGSVIAVSLAPVLWRTSFLGTVSIFRDVTSEVQVDRLKSEFVANVSHELRTPMTSIKGYVEILLMGAAGELTQQQKHFLSVVKTNTERLSVLVNDLLDISRMETGRVVLNIQELNLRELVDDVILDVRRRSQEENKAMNFEVVADANLPPVKGDVERVRQVLSSLITNGYNYTPAEGLVEVGIHATGDEVQIDVRDNGIGIHPGDQHRIFERFYRGEDPLVLSTAGTGLGLAIARALVGMHNGRIWFTSSGVRGQGSTFSFTLPINELQE